MTVCVQLTETESRSDQRSVTLDIRAHHQDVARLQRGVVDQQAEQHLPQHVDLPGRAVAAVHLHRPVAVPQRASLWATGIRGDIGLQPAQQGVGPAGAAEELVGGDRGGQAALQLAQVAALVDDGDSVSLRVLTNPALQQRVMRLGVRRLLLLTVPIGKRAAEARLTNASRLSIARSMFALDELVRDCTVAVTDRVLTEAGGPVWTEAEFIALRRRCADEVPGRVAEALATVAEILGAVADVDQRLERLTADAVRSSADDARAQLERLVRPGFVIATGAHRLPDVLRYVRGIVRRLDKLPDDPGKDRRNMIEVVALEQRYAKLVRRLDRAAITPDVIDIGWQLEELRIHTFAQVLGTPRPVSPQRILKSLTAVGG